MGTEITIFWNVTPCSLGRQLQTYRRNLMLPGSGTFTTRQQGLPLTMASRPKDRNLHRLRRLITAIQTTRSSGNW